MLKRAKSGCLLSPWFWQTKRKVLKKSCRYYPESNKMSYAISTPSKCSSKAKQNSTNSNEKTTGHAKARTFVEWYKDMIDNNRHKLGLYLSDDVTLEWFGRTIKLRKNVSSYIKYDMKHNRHDFTTVQCIDQFPTRQQSVARKDESILASPIETPEKPRTRKRKLEASFSSPEWAPGCKPDESETKKSKISTHDGTHDELVCHKDSTVISNKGDGIERKSKHKYMPITPPNHEIGQGDCLPSTSEAEPSKLDVILNTELPRLAVECNGYIEFTHTKNNVNSVGMKRERECKIQISYSEDQLNVGEYIIWALRYVGESKCRRNLLASFEEVAKS